MVRHQVLVLAFGGSNPSALAMIDSSLVKYVLLLSVNVLALRVEILGSHVATRSMLFYSTMISLVVLSKYYEGFYGKSE